VEGSNGNSQWCAFGEQPGAIWHGDRCGLACDWWRNAERDFDLMQQFAMQAHRLSVEWSRIEPRPGEFDVAALDRYRAMLGGLRARGIEPMVCFHHFTNPLWLQERGAWEHAEVVERFAYFVRTACAALSDLCTQWMTINEPLIYVHHGYIVGLFPPAQANIGKGLRVYRNMLLAHGAAYHAIHAVQPHAQVGNAAAVRNFTPLRPGHPGDRAATALQRYLGEEVWFRALLDGRIRPPLGAGEFHAALKGAFDWTGLNYYTTSLVRGTLNPLEVFGKIVHPAGAELSDSGRGGPYSWYAPDGLYDVCTDAARLGKPIYVTENGLPDADDDQRPRWLIGHLAALHRAIQDGADVRGYYHWTFVDNFEWAEGWGLRFGLVEMDPVTQERRPRPSASLYRDIIRANAVTPQMVRQYAPELLTR
jgi:beta-glucosidase